MAKLTHRQAFYADGTIEEGKTKRKSFKTDGLVGVVSFYDDGTREDEGLRPTQKLSKGLEPDIDTLIAQKHFEAHLQFKYDGGDTGEIKALRMKKMGRI